MKSLNIMKWIALIFAFWISSPAFLLKADDAPTASANPVIFNRVRYFPVQGREKDVLGAKILVSNVSATDGFQELGEIKELPPTGQWGELTFVNTTPYRWIKYLAAPGTHGSIGKLEFYDGDQRLKPNMDEVTSGFEANKWADALRVDDPEPNIPTTRHISYNPDNQYVVVDLGDAAAGLPPTFDPAQTESANPLTVAIKSNTPGAVIRYTLDGTIPTLENSQVYTSPLTINKTTTINASAFVEGLAPTPVVFATYIVGTPLHRETFHLGNSLTGITREFDVQARTAGSIHHSFQYTPGGAMTKLLWNAAMGNIGDPNNKEQWLHLYGYYLVGDPNMVYTLARIKQEQDHWSNLWPRVTEIDDMTLQPRDFDIAEEADYDNRFINLAMQKTPQVQPWLYVEWVEQNFGPGRPTNTGKEPTSEMKTTYPALTWEEAMGGMTLYGEDLKRKVNENYKGNKPLRIIPAALAMGWIYHMIENGEVPGFAKDDFYGKIMGDEVHPNRDGAYLVDCMFYAAFYGESPEGKFLPLRTHLTATQAQIMQHLAWDTMENYPDSGYYQEGATPVGEPEFSPAAQPISKVTQVSLSSSTPGAWFRYTLDGTAPSRTNGYIYCGVISARPDMTIKAMAYKSGMADSPVTQITYPAAPSSTP